MICDICLGDGYIRLPIHRAARATYDAAIPSKMEASIRTFKCPQCEEKQIADERVETCGVSLEINEHMSEHAKDFMHKQAALALAEHMLRNDAIRFKTKPRYDGKIELIGTVATVTQNQIERIEAKERRAAVEHAKRVVLLACEKIGHWGSYYGHHTVRKDEAYRFIEEAAAQLAGPT